MVQFSHPYMTTGKTIALTRQIFVGKVMSLFFNMLSRFVTTFFPRSRFFPSGGQSIGASASAPVLPVNIELTSFRIDWFNLFAIQGTLKSLLQNHTLKTSILWHSAFFMVQLSHPHMTTGKNTLTIQTFVGKVMSPLFNTLFRPRLIPTSFQQSFFFFFCKENLYYFALVFIHWICS